MKISKLGLSISTLLFSVIFGTTIAFADSPANITIEGNSNLIVTGESYATNIQLAGYNSRNKKFYTNFAAETTKAVATGSIATFKYDINVFDGTSVLLGNLGSYTAPQTIAAAAGSQTVQVNNQVLTLASPLTSEFKEVINIDSVTIAP